MWNSTLQARDASESTARFEVRVDAAARAPPLSGSFPCERSRSRLGRLSGSIPGTVLVPGENRNAGTNESKATGSGAGGSYHLVQGVGASNESFAQIDA